MIAFITILIVLACVILAFFVLIQKPKGGGLAGNFGSIGAQVMGVKQSTDVMEKGTWTTMGFVAILCVVGVMFLQKAPKDTTPKQPTQNSAPAQPAGGQQPGGAPAQPQPGS